MSVADRRGWQLTGRHVLMALIAFFGVMLIANGVFVYLALTTFTGEETPDAYRKGLAYNSAIEDAKRLPGAEWQGELSLKGDPATLTLSLQDTAKAPVRGLTVKARIGRPATDRNDAELSLDETEAGLYAARLPNAAPGSWIATLVATRLTSAGETVVYRHKERLWLAPAK